jgi:NodT family efflux transporter outer membrane factor (OMF) lipoprotein
MTSSIRTAATALLALLITACAAGPDYEPPATDAGSGWVTPPANPDQPSDLSRWWQAFEDPSLDRLMARALEQNLDLREASARIAEARAASAAASSGYLPTIVAAGSANRRRQSANGPLPIDAIPGIERDQTIYDIGFDASWEIDLFGRTRREVEATEARIGQAEARRDAVELAVTAEVARTYFAMRGAEQRLEARRAAVAAARRTADLVQIRCDAGESSAAEVAQSQADLRSLEARLPALEAERRTAALSLGLLVGGLPEAGLALLEPDAAPIELAPFPVGERGDLLRRRPDVSAAERALAAATADVGVATAEWFPRLTIGANGGFESLATGNLFDAGSETWSIVPRLTWRVFDGGRVRAGVDAARARTEAAATAYDRAVFAAIADAERALARYQLGLEAVDRQRVAVAAAARSHEYAAERYRAGDVSLLELLDAERVLRDAQDAVASLKESAAIDLVSLVKSLGGGWAHSG